MNPITAFSQFGKIMLQLSECEYVAYERRKGERFRIMRECVIECANGSEHEVRLQDISAVGAYLQSDFRPPLGSDVRLQHPSVGAISGIVSRHEAHGFAIAFRDMNESVVFALSAMAHDMSQDPAMVWRPAH